MTLDLTLGGLITLAWVLTTVACVVMGVLVVAVKSERHLGQRSKERRLAPLRTDVLLVATGEDTEDGEALARLTAVTGRARRDLHGLVVQLLGKVRGEPAEQLRRPAARARRPARGHAPHRQPASLAAGAGAAPHRVLPRPGRAGCRDHRTGRPLPPGAQPGGAHRRARWATHARRARCCTRCAATGCTSATRPRHWSAWATASRRPCCGRSKRATHGPAPWRRTCAASAACAPRHRCS